MQKTKRIYIALILILATLICGVFCVNYNSYVVYADEEDEWVEEDIGDKMEETRVLWEGGIEPFALLDLNNNVNSESNPYIIDTPDKLAYLAFAIEQGKNYGGTYFKQTANFDLGGIVVENIISGNEWNPIGYKSNFSRFFAGIYDGNGYSIINMVKQGTLSNSFGLFGYTKGATIKNVTLRSQINVKGEDVGCLVGYAEDTTIENCDVYATILGTFTRVGVLCGNIVGNKQFEIKANSVSGKINASSNSYNIGGVAGCANNLSSEISITISDVVSRVQINASTGAGGICYATTGNITIKNCVNEGNINVNGSNNVGGIVGVNSSIIENSTNNATIQSTGSYVGGIAGQNTKLISNCKNQGKIEGQDYVGGVVGVAKDEVSDCINYGLIVGNDFVGGIAGLVFANEVGKYNFTKNFNASNIKGNNYVAGIVGKLTNVNMNYCFVVDNDNDNVKGCIEGNNYVAGLAAMIDNANVFGCYANISVKSNDIGAGLIATYVGSSSYSNMNAIDFIGEVTGIRVAGLIQSASHVNLYYGYSVAKLNTKSNVAINTSESGAVVGVATDCVFNRIYFNKDYYLVGCGNAEFETIISATTNELINTSFTAGDRAYFCKHEDNQVGMDYYYDYYPVLTVYYFGVGMPDGENYFKNNNEVSGYTTKAAIAKTYDSVRISFYTNCDAQFDPIYVKQNVDISDLIPKTLEKQGYVFAGWYLDKDMAIKFNPSNGLSKSARLYARFDYPETNFPWWIFIIIIAVSICSLGVVYFIIMQKRTVKFRVEGFEIPDMKVKVGDELKLPKPKKSGYRFKGWYYNEELTKKFDVDIMPNINLILFGELVKVEKKQDNVDTKKSKTSKSKTSKKEDVKKDKTKE